MIAISAGHYPAQKGAQYEGRTEWDEAILWASRICQLVGPAAVLIPTGTVRQKVDYINAGQFKAVIEIHFNSDPGRAGQGSEALYYPKSKAGRDLAERLQDRLGSLFMPNRGAKEGWYRANPNNGPIFLLEKVRPKAVILEPEFIHNFDEIAAKREAACLMISEVVSDELER